MSRVGLARVTALIGYFGLLGLVLIWHGALAPSPHFPVAVVLSLAAVPLLLPLRGLLHGRPYTHAWAAFLSLAYFAHGVMVAVSEPTASLLGVAEVILSLTFFAGAVAYIRASARHTSATSR